MKTVWCEVLRESTGERQEELASGVETQKKKSWANPTVAA